MDRAALEALLEKLRRAIADMDNELSESGAVWGVT
jgi:hypothetical protein